MKEDNKKRGLAVDVDAIVSFFLPRLKKLEEYRREWVRACCMYHKLGNGSVKIDDNTYIPARYYWGLKIAETAHLFNKNKYWFMNYLNSHISS